MKPYDHKKIEKKWQKTWASKKVYASTETAKKDKFYILDMFPYPSGEGLHVGHPKGYIATDVVSRFKRMNGFNVLHPMGWDAFGLPAENYAIKNKVHPEIAVKKNVARYKEQLEIIGLDYDWKREINTTDPEYYKWTQWIFLQLYKKGLAFESYEPINWCPSCKTGLANEDLEDGKCERCGSVVEKKPMRQWVLRITDYADRMLADLDGLNWPASIKESQRNWIGRSEGAEFRFKIQDLGIKNKKGETEELALDVFTTRPDTLFGVTYVVVAPEHPLIDKVLGQLPNKKAVIDYVAKARAMTEIERTDAKKDKSGVALEGVFAVNPATGEQVPVWIADYVLGNYGTGAVMAVPAHDHRDFAFATKYKLPIKEVVEPLYKKIGPQDGVRTELPFKKRHAAVAIIKHWSEDKYLCLKWKKTDWRGFVIGGIENGETAAQAAAREIVEETGYTSAKFVRDIPGIVNAQFFHVVKNENRWAHFHPVVFELQNGDRIDTEQAEKDIHEVQWISKGEVDRYLGWVDDMRLIWERAFHLKPWTSDNHLSNPEVLTTSILINSDIFTGQESDVAGKAITAKFGTAKVTYKLKDWVFSRQRYWGEPIPMIHCESCGVVPVPEKDLPVKLPKVAHYEPSGTGESPLATIEKWVNVKCPACKGKARRETNTMPQWAGSSWYYLRYMDPKNKKQLVDPKKEKYWAPVDFYVGGAEHATRHLIYARFWHKFLYDLGVVSTAEPFKRLQNVGLIMATDGRKMSKRYGNVINPDEVVAAYGADTFRMYEMFMGPFDQAVAWSSESIIGVRRFVDRVWRLQEKVVIKASKKTPAPTLPEKTEILLNQTIERVGNDIENIRFNTAVSALMILLNELETLPAISKDTYATLLQLIAPFTPHIADELWTTIGNSKSIHTSVWPKVDQTKLISKTVTIVVQVNGKVKTQLELPLGTSEKEATDKALLESIVSKAIDGKQIRKVIFVPNKILNFVV